ncbi:hypothetical protein ACQW02_07530 [Humitalea sp. 24SJ18S-53]|uniref:hypothetical protein n=1 Tax=Humitalea sp. 24SJ18S-53 TaxID=3422307 RepID=UPI003D672B82
MEPFRVDPGRLYDVRPDGVVETAVPVPETLVARHHARLRRWWVCAVLLNALTMGATAMAAALLGWGVAARVALLALLALPLLAVAPFLARFGAPGGRRRHRARPRDFPQA